MSEQAPNSNSEGFIRGFRAIVIVTVTILLGYFIYSSGDTRPFKLGLDLAGGSHLVYEADVSSLSPEEVPDLMNVLREVIERRVNVFGVSEPVVQVEQSSRVAEEQHERLIVELPGVANVDDAVKEIGKTPLLEFRLIDATGNVEEVSTNTPATATPQNFIDTGLTGRYLLNAELVFGQGNAGGLSNEPIVSIVFNEDGAQLFEDITREHVGEQLAIFLDGELMSAPVINEAIGGGRAIISGQFTPEEARELVRNLNFGALPVPIELVSTQTIGAALGERAISAGVYSGTLGLIAIGLFMILWYRLPGVVAAFSLVTYVLIMLVLFKLIPVTLTAAGLAGLILSIGLAVDANILISERLKEGLRSGKKLTEAINEGFNHAWTSIRDGNLVNIICGVILYWFGDVFIEGFAFTLIIGTIVSLLSSLIISRTLLLALRFDERKSLTRFLFGSGIHT